MAATVVNVELAPSTIIIVCRNIQSLFEKTLKLIGNYVNCDILI